MQRVRIALRPPNSAVQRIFEPGITDEGEVRFLHRQIDVLTFAGAVPVQQRQGDCRKSHRARQPDPGTSARN